MHKHGTKTTPVFLPADGEASWLLLPSSVSLLSGGTVQPENTYSSILKAPSPHEVRLTTLGTNQVFQSLGGNAY